MMSAMVNSESTLGVPLARAAPRGDVRPTHVRALSVHLFPASRGAP